MESIYSLSFLFQPKCGELSEYTDSGRSAVEDPSSRCTNASDDDD